jgi:hypothetical protein
MYVCMYECIYAVCVGARALSILWHPHTKSSQMKWLSHSAVPCRQTVLMPLDNLVVWAASGKWITGVERVSRGTITQAGDSTPAGPSDG